MPVGADGARGKNSIGTGLLLSALVHGAVVTLMVVWGLRLDAPRPPIYRVEMIAAPTGVRQAGVVEPPKAADNATKAEAPSGAERASAEKPLPSKKAPVATAKATPSPARTKAAGAKSPAPSKAPAALPAAGSREGGKGADVRSIRLEGIAFPFPGYLQNIVRQITIAYRPRRTSAALVAEVKFIIRRDGSVADIETVKSSGDRLFDIEAQGTIESIGATKGFGPLPSGWNDDVLVVYFTFDYALRPS